MFASMFAIARRALGRDSALRGGIPATSLETGMRTIARANPDIVEVLPGVIFPEVASILQQALPGPFIAGGFIRNAADVARVRAAGGILSSTSTYKLWHRVSA